MTSSRVDYCNNVLYGTCTAHLHLIQSVLNGAARLIVGKRKYDHITDTMCHYLHWLPVRQRIQYKLCMLVREGNLRPRRPPREYLGEYTS